MCAAVDAVSGRVCEGQHVMRDGVREVKVVWLLCVRSQYMARA